MWVYVQDSGKLLRPDGSQAGIGYSGCGEGKNNPAMQHVEKVGPLPCGIYFLKPPVDTEDHGPYVIWLIPATANEMFGRSGFGEHGDGVHDPGKASEGCIVQDHAVRVDHWTSGDHVLSVIATQEPTS